MTEEFRDELISAYVDGEVSPSERAEVEKQLAERADLRQLFEELQSQRSQMQSLPRHRLDHDLGQTILRRAEQAVLAGSDGRRVAAVASSVAARGDSNFQVGTARSRPGTSLSDWWQRGAGWRRLAWPAVAAAAALAILLFDLTRQDAQRPLAKVDQEAAPTEALAERVSAEGTDNLELPYRSEPSPVNRGVSAEARATSPKDEGEPATSAESQRRMTDRKVVSGTTRAPAEGAAPAASPTPAMPPRSMPAGAEDRYGGAKITENLAIDPSPPSVVVEVSPDYIANGSLEKVFAQNGVVWQRVDAARQRQWQARRASEVDASSRMTTLSRPHEQVLYFVDGTADQAGQIVTQLRKDTAGVKRVLSTPEALRDQSGVSKNSAEPLKKQAAARYFFALEAISNDAGKRSSEKAPPPAAKPAGPKP